MIDPEGEERALLEVLRTELSPTAADVSRVLHATRAAIQLGAAGNGLPAAPGVTAPPARLPPRLAQLMGALSIAAASGMAGYALGLHHTDERPSAAPKPVVQAAPPQLEAPISAPDEVAPALDETPTRAPLLDHAGSARGARTPRPVTPSSLKEEIDTMRRVDRLLHDREPRRALALLYELDRNVPNGKLMQEREAAFAMARCVLGLVAPAQLAREFAERYPDSVYLARLRQLCPDDQRIEAPRETHE